MPYGRSSPVPTDPARAALEARWLHLTRETLPGLAGTRGWPVRHDHCFGRILLDAVCGCRWIDHISARPAYKAIDDERLVRAVELAQAVADGAADLHALDDQSLAWRGKTRTRLT